ncbi:hypothetical protein DL351_13095 [Pseudomonas aeruginosa]|uniref:JAB domain-containing protein n=1 Tax=Pseudomonas aeruginosa TaxID=287 RepID=UPI000F4DB2DD|nr:JAB domain-containing protein [Pseudomonas aeruginosa]AYW40385.1 hypothetical protein DL351_13095 [Pseudomonas aeruginosa]
MTAKFKAGESAGTYIAEAPVTEADIVEMAQHLASKRLRKGQALHQPKEVFSYLQLLLQDYEHEVFALLLLDSKHRVIRFEELFRGTLDSASVYPREVVKVALEHNAAAMVFAHYVARNIMRIMCPVFLCSRSYRFGHISSTSEHGLAT